jgi:hypothetical protein
MDGGSCIQEATEDQKVKERRIIRLCHNLKSIMFEKFQESI